MNEQHPLAGIVPGRVQRRAREGDWLALLPWAGGLPALLDATDAERACTATLGDMFVFANGHIGNGAPESLRDLAGRCISDGDSALSRLAGEFALIAYDTRRQRGIAVRDPLGARPLFYAVVRDGVLLARCIESLLDHPEVQRTPNRAALADHLCQRWPENSETFYAAVRRVPPGHALRVEGHTYRVARYFNLSRRRRAPRRWADAGETAQLSELLRNAIERATAGERSAIFLSGGIDSVTVAAIAADSCRARGLPEPLALSLVFPDDDCNEEFVQRRVARQLGLSHGIHGLDPAMGGADVLSSALALAAHWPVPLLNFWLPAYLSLAREARARGCATVLTGGGGDEWLNVSPYIAADLLVRADVAGIYRLWRAAARSTRFSAPHFAVRLAWTFGLRPHASMLAARALGAAAPQALSAWRRHRIARATPRWVAPDRALRRELHARGEAVPPLPKGPFGMYFREMQAGLDHTLTSMEMEEWDEAGRRTGVSIVQPFWDAAVVALLHRVDPRALIQGGRNKGLVRDVLDQRFPGLGFGTQKKVLSSDFYRAQLRAGAPAALDAIGPLQALADLAVIDGTAAQRFLRDVVARDDGSNVHHLWNVLALEAWARNHF